MVSSFSYGLNSMIELNQYTTPVNIIKIITYDSYKQILNSLHTIEVHLRSTTQIDSL